MAKQYVIFFTAYRVSQNLSAVILMTLKKANLDRPYLHDQLIRSIMKEASLSMLMQLSKNLKVLYKKEHAARYFRSALQNSIERKRYISLFLSKACIPRLSLRSTIGTSTSLSRLGLPSALF